MPKIKQEPLEYVEFEDVKPKKMKTEPFNFHDYQLPIKKEIKQEFHYHLPIQKEQKEKFKIEKNYLKLGPQDVKTEHGKPDRRFDIKPLKYEEPQKEKNKREKSKLEKVEP